jgi:membrane protein implicated in regulation of membrane protease activity
MIRIDIEPEPKAKEGIPRWLAITLVSVLILALWGACCLFVLAALSLSKQAILPSLGDMATLLFGASSVALIIFSLLIGGVAVFGYSSLKEGLRKDIEKDTNKRFDAVEKELRGRVLAGIGMVLGMFYLQGEREHEEGGRSEEEKNERADYLAEIVENCWAAYKILKEVEGNSKYMALNNALYFSSIQGDKGQSGRVLQKARELEPVAHDKNFWEGLLTYCRVILAFSEDAEEIAKAKKLASDLAMTKELTERQRREATSYVASLAAKLAKHQPLPKVPSPPDR